MTEEELIKRIFNYLGYCDSSVLERINDIIYELYEQNVVIPKGKNRHPYADVLHEWVEDTTKKLQSREYSFSDGKYHWTACDIKYAVRTITTELRIKPSEPVYE